jgi:hypothetical protein
MLLHQEYEHMEHNENSVGPWPISPKGNPYHRYSEKGLPD